MARESKSWIEEFLDLPNHLSISHFESYVAKHLERRQDKYLALQELDRIIGNVQNHLVLLSLYLKQNHIIKNERANSDSSFTGFYTKQEVANKYRVSIRTVTNWIIDGLEAVNIGGIKRISHEAICTFVKQNKSKKFAWRSIAKK